MKKKLYAFVVMLCLFAISCFSGCTLVSKDVNAEREQDLIVVGEKTLTTNDIINSFYSFYQQNQYAFYYSDQKTVMDSFYKSVISREIVLQEAEKLLDDGIITLTDDDYTKVWNNVFDYFHDQVDTYEKNLLAHNDIDKESDKYPTRFKDDEDADKKEDIKFEEYKFEEVEAYTAGAQGTLATVASKISELKTFVTTKYVEDADAETRTVLDIPNSDLSLRSEAFDKYVASLMLAAKVNGKSYDKTSALKEEIQRILDVYVESALYEEYKEYVNALIITAEYDKLSKEAVVNKYVELLGKDSEKYETYANYTKVLAASDNESLILYHNGEETTYFTVQHILVKFNDTTLAALKENPGYDTKMDIALREYYEDSVRAGYAAALENDKCVEYRNAGTGLDIGHVDGTKYSANDILNLYFDASASATTAAERAQIFNKLSWEFSQDTGSLVNKLSNVIGFAISSENYEHGTLAKDFTNGARELYEDYDPNGDNVGFAVSDYGIHIMMLTGIYKSGAVAPVAYNADGSVNIDDTFDNMNDAKVSNLTNQSIYHYVYDLIKESLIGEKGTFFTETINAKVAEYDKAGKIKDKNDRPTYDELLEALR